MDEEEVGLPKEQYIMMKKHESREKGLPLDVIATWGANVWEPDGGLWCRLSQVLKSLVQVLEPYPPSPNFSPAGVLAAFGGNDWR